MILPRNGLERQSPAFITRDEWNAVSMTGSQRQSRALRSWRSPPSGQHHKHSRPVSIQKIIIVIKNEEKALFCRVVDPCPLGRQSSVEIISFKGTRRKSKSTSRLLFSFFFFLQPIDELVHVPDSFGRIIQLMDVVWVDKHARFKGRLVAWVVRLRTDGFLEPVKYDFYSFS